MKSKYELNIISGKLTLTPEKDVVTLQHHWEAGSSHPIRLTLEDVTRLVIALAKSVGDR